LDVKRFTVLDPTRPTLIRAKYGPFSTKQTVPARYVLPEFQDEEEANATEADLLGRHLPPVPHQLEVSAHLVNTEVTRAHPALRVLVHGAGARGHHSPHVCVTVIARRRNDALSASCTPTGAKETGGDATCLVTMAVPARWWPPHTRATFKLPRVAVQVSYLVGTAAGPKECAVRDAGGPNQGGPRVTVQPETPVGEVILTLDPHGYDELSSDPLVHVLVPRAPLHPATAIHAPLYLHPPGNCRRSCSSSGQSGAPYFNHESLTLLASDALPLEERLTWTDEIHQLDLQSRRTLRDFVGQTVLFLASRSLLSDEMAVVVGTSRLRQIRARNEFVNIYGTPCEWAGEDKEPRTGAGSFTVTKTAWLYAPDAGVPVMEGRLCQIPKSGYYLDLLSPAIANNRSCEGSA
ncbi:uncharacterized protein LOC119588819, partial [Penaeus monodon]|uniref:uncharacterized protein LOC119588819 n=1 Tax=Penaeus monodon TaxID=6687 RepID=UPI0018A76E43